MIWAHEESIFLRELKECSKRIYEFPQFAFFALGYAMERVLSMSRKGINGFFPQKVRSQQLNLFEHFKIEDSGAFVFKNWETQAIHNLIPSLRVLAQHFGMRSHATQSPGSLPVSALPNVRQMS